MNNHSHHGHGSDCQDENKALLKYMAEHNCHHIEELSELAPSFPENVRQKIESAVKLLSQGTALLKEAYQETERD